MRRHVATVGEGVDPRAVGHPLAPGELEQGAEMIDVGVDAAVGDEPEQVHVAVALAGATEHAEQRLVVEERAVGDGRAYAHEILEEDPSRADREVPDLGVPHLAVGQADGTAGSCELRVRVALPQRVEDGRLRQLDGVARAGRRQTPAVEDHERDQRYVAARQMAANESGSRDAPPTSAPSTPGWASSSAALSGLTEPP